MKALVLAGGFDQIALIEELQKRGYTCILADYYEDPPAKEAADLHIQASTLDVDRIKQIAIEYDVDLITTACTDQALLTVAKVSEELGLPCYINYQSALNVTNKSYMKACFEKFNIPTARHVIVDSCDGLANVTEHLRKPLVVKPVDCNSSKGVVKVLNEEELTVAVRNAINFSRTDTAVVEEYISGREYTVDFWIDRGTPRLLMVSEITKFPESFTINGCRTLPTLPENKISQLNLIAKKISEAFELDNMPMFMQVMDNGDEIFVLEFSARMGGGTKYRMIELYSGVPIMSVYTDRVCGVLPNIGDRLTKKHMLLYFLYCTKGVYKEITGVDSAIKLGLVDEWYQYKKPGACFEKAQNSGDRVASILLTGDDDREIEHKRVEACQVIRVMNTDGTDMLLRL